MASLCLAFFKFSTGWVHDKKGLRFTMLMCDSAAILSFILLALVANTAVGRVVVAIFAVLRAAALPLETIMLPLITAKLFGQKDYAKILGIVVAINTAGYAVGNPLANVIFDLQGTYVPAFIFFGVTMAVVTVTFVTLLNKTQKQTAA